MSSFGYSSTNYGDGVKVGTIINALYNPSDAYNTYLPCDSSKVSRSAYPLLSNIVPANIGTYTGTNRTLLAIPTSNACDTDGTQWIVAGAAGTTGLVSINSSYTNTNITTPASFNTASVKWLGGANWVAANAASAQPLYSSNSGSTFTAATGADITTTKMQDCMAYSPTLGSGSGRIAYAVGGTSSGTIYTSDDYGHTYTARTTGLSGLNIFHLVWTGTQYLGTIGTANQYITSPDGITWTANYYPFNLGAATATSCNLCSDGNGTITLCESGATGPGTDGLYSIIVSINNGATWQLVQPPGGIQGSNWTIPLVVSRTNGKWFCSTENSGGIIGGLWVSADGKTWIASNDQTTDAGGSAINSGASFTYANGVYLSISNNNSRGATTAISLVEDLSKFYLPQSTYTGVNYTLSTPQWIKAK